MGLGDLGRTIRTARHLRWSQIAARAKRTIRRHLPLVRTRSTLGVTGWAQINGRDELSIPAKVKCDVYYLNHQSFLLDLKTLLGTCVKVLRRDGVRQADEVQSNTIYRKAA